MAIVHSYVKLPEGNSIPTQWGANEPISPHFYDTEHGYTSLSGVSAINLGI